MLSDQDLGSITRLIEQHCKPAILLYPPFPPHLATRGRSKIGGRPNLPADCPWPIGKYHGKPTPLHFLAQIDCAELPRFGHGLPTRGVLFFFGCDLDHDWCAENPSDDACVLYVERMPLDVPDRAPPDDLPPIREAYASNGRIVAHGGLPGEEGPKIHIEWPLTARKIDTWPDSSAFEDIGNHLEMSFPRRVFSSLWALSLIGKDRDKYNAAARRNQDVAEAYSERVRFKRFDAFVGATGIMDKFNGHNLPWNHNALQYCEPWPADGVRFPQFGIMIDRLARHVVKDALFAQNWGGADMIEQYEMRKRAIVDAAGGWIARAREIGSLVRPSEADVNAINAWLKDIHGERGKLPSSQQQSTVNLDTGRLVRDALVDTINALASTAPEKFPARYYEVLTQDFTPFWQAGKKLEQHQMLGHAPSSQEARAIDDPTICLLQLPSCNVRHMTFGDAGECTFWIKGNDLAARRFDKAWATIGGH